jgi:hypothetical protein
MSWATTNPDAIYQFASDRPKARTTQEAWERRIKQLAVVEVVLLPVAIALYFLLPPSPVAAVAVGLLFGFGVSIPVGCLGCLLALWTGRRREVQPRTTVQVSGSPAYNGALFAGEDGRLEFLDNEELFLYGLDTLFITDEEQ